MIRFRTVASQKVHLILHRGNEPGRRSECAALFFGYPSFHAQRHRIQRQSKLEGSLPGNRRIKTGNLAAPRFVTFVFAVEAVL
jgi:hypothetical protein